MPVLRIGGSEFDRLSRYQSACSGNLNRERRHAIHFLSRDIRARRKSPGITDKDTHAEPHGLKVTQRVHVPVFYACGLSSAFDNADIRVPRTLQLRCRHRLLCKFFHNSKVSL